MSNESSKTRAARGDDFESRYLHGRIIDIGCGTDPVVPNAEPFDVIHGDAQNIASMRTVASYDAVVSSHCLEHMRDVPMAISQWWSLLKDNGHLILVVPDEDLYEQGAWPSIFNRDHKATFRINKSSSWSPVSYDLIDLVSRLPHAKVLAAERHDLHYDYSLQKTSISGWQRTLFATWRLIQSLFRCAKLSETAAERVVFRAFVWLGSPVDQTQGEALAQIQVIVRKDPSVDLESHARE